MSSRNAEIKLRFPIIEIIVDRMSWLLFVPVPKRELHPDYKKSLKFVSGFLGLLLLQAFSFLQGFLKLSF